MIAFASPETDASQDRIGDIQASAGTDAGECFAYKRLADS
jgi:hypothetical protein